jgi:hypothetical protein
VSISRLPEILSPCQLSILNATTAFACESFVLLSFEESDSIFISHFSVSPTVKLALIHRLFFS